MLQCMDILLNHMMETKEGKSTTVDLLIRYEHIKYLSISIIYTLMILYRFDMLLQHVIQTDRLVDVEIVQLINELCGTLYCHCGKYLLGHHHEVMS